MALVHDKNRKYWIAVYLIATLVFIVLRYLFDIDFFRKVMKLDLRQLDSLLGKWTLTLALISIVLLIRTVLEMLISKTDQSQGDKYNLMRITRLIAVALVAYVAISSLFINPYKSLAGLGIASLILGFALQAPIASFISWLYIVFRSPYKVGDRIQIAEHRGDVIEISYLDTTIEECSGDYLQNDRKSGRLIHFPNSKILTDRIINYSGYEVPFIWNETALQVAFTSDLEFVEKCFLEIAEKDLRERFPNQADYYVKRWPAAVYFRISPRAWLEVVVSYPVEPTDTTGKRNRILTGVLPLLNEYPERVKFPEGRSR